VSTSLPLDDDAYALRSALWLTTDRAYKAAAEQLQKVQANARVTAESEDKSDDFSRESPAQYLEAPAEIQIDRAGWETRLRSLSALFRRWPDVESATVSLQAIAQTRYYANIDGTRYQIASTHGRVMINAMTTADDGMALHRFEAFDVRSLADLPTNEQIAAKIETVASDLAALRKAPIAEPYLGPAILEGKAASVFFHEVFGHRIEGHRQKNETEGQTFAKKIGQSIMPDFINVFDDPTIAKLNGRDLNGFYRFDDEGVPASRASLVERGVLKTFLLSRAPTRGFTTSNGHGRRSEHYSVVARQANLVVAPTRTVDRATLKQMLLDQVKQQGKPYGLVFRELDGGFTMTQRFEPQSYKLLSIMVYRVYPDGREELVRGADLEGTPLRSLADITAASDEVDVFNGYCGAESGFVPVSASSPSLLVAHVEVAKKPKATDKPPILPAPPWTGGAR
jgi:TldD protein